TEYPSEDRGRETGAGEQPPAPPARSLGHSVTRSLSFELLATDGAARRGRLHTPHGTVETPVFMPVGTQAAVKGLTPDQVAGAGASIILANTYHPALRPGDHVVAEMG